jgi:thioredoxin-like negative regulator of GroEL
MTLPVLHSIENRQALLELLRTNPGLIFIKFGAEWCAPCKKIEKDLEVHYQNMSDNIQCVVLDIDNSIDVYAYLKSKKIVTSIPSVICYQKGSVTYVPDDVYSGSDKKELDSFFHRCKEELL